MGCTSSRETESTPAVIQRAPPPPTATSPTVRPLNPPPRLNPSTQSTRTQSITPSTAAPSTTPHHEPLQPPAPWHSSTRTWTPSQLTRERAAFFETRVTGRAEIWAALASACELLRAGQLENARGVVEAAEVTLPTGSLVEGGYDTWGGLYRVPREVLSDPTDIQAEIGGEEDGIGDGDGETVVGSVPANLKGKGIMAADGGDGGVDETERAKRREEKGKGKAVLDKDAVKVRCRLSDRGGPDVVIMLGKAQSVGVLGTRVGDEAAIPNTARIRIAYLGKILDEKETLGNSGWKEGHVLNALVVGQL